MSHFFNKQLNDNSTLADHNIWKDSTVRLVLLPYPRGTMEIYVKRLDGATTPLEVQGSNTVDDVKIKIYEKDGFRPSEQRLIFAGRQLEGDRTLEYYKIDRECTLHLVLCLCGC